LYLFGEQFCDAFDAQERKSPELGQLEDYMHELKLYQKLDHPNILKVQPMKLM